MTHRMIYVERTADGGYLYACPVCGRQVVWYFNGASTAHTVLCAGDETAAHAGGNVVVDNPTVDQRDWLEPYNRYFAGRG